MFVRIYWARIYPGSWRAIRDWYPRLAAIPSPGLLGRFMTLDVNDGESMFVITLWRDAESAENADQSSEYRQMTDALMPFVVGAQVRSLCEVKAFDIAELLSEARNLGSSGSIE